MIMNVLHGLQSDNYILQARIQDEWQKLIRILQKRDFKDIKFPVKVRDIHRIKLVLLVMKMRKKQSIYES